MQAATLAVELSRQHSAEETALDAIANKTVEVYGRLDTWVHVFAIGIFATFNNTTPEEFKHVINVDLMGQVYGAMVALPHLKREGRGALIHVSSMEGRRSLPYQSAYSYNILLSRSLKMHQIIFTNLLLKTKELTEILVT